MPPSSVPSGDPVDWYPARILQERRPDVNGEQPQVDTTSSAGDAAADFALVVLNQPLKDIPTLKRLWDNSSWRVAADGGANRLLDVVRSQERKTSKRPRQHGAESHENGETEEGPWNLMDTNKLDIIIGDLDSLSSEARAYFTNPNNAPSSNPKKHRSDDDDKTLIIHDPDQESTDFGKAVTHIRHNPPHAPLNIVALGGLGGRVDQGLSQLHHLYLYQQESDYEQGRLFLVSESSVTFLLKGGGGQEGPKRKHRIHVREHGASDEVLFDKYVGIIPMKEPSLITTKGLEWDVTDWETEFGGRMSTSNHVLPETKVVEVETIKDVLFTIALKRGE